MIKWNFWKKYAFYFNWKLKVKSCGFEENIIHKIFGDRQILGNARTILNGAPKWEKKAGAWEMQENKPQSFLKRMRA